MATVDVDNPRNVLVSDSDPFLELQMLGTIISGVAYGFVIQLSVKCCRLVWRKSFPSRSRAQIFYLCYIAAMFLISTASFVIGIIITTRSTFHRGYAPSPGKFRLDLLFVPVALNHADGFMIYRCLMLYHYAGGSPTRRIALRCLLGLFALLLLGTGFLLGIGLLIEVTNRFEFPSFIGVVSLTALINFTLASLISLRLYFHQRRARLIFGSDFGSPYSRIITICVESCALIIIVDLAFVVLTFASPHVSTIPQQLLVHASAISPLLLIARVAQGRDAVSTMQSRSLEVEKISEPLRIVPPSSTADEIQPPSDTSVLERVV